MSPIEIMLVCLSVIACLSKIREDLSEMWGDSHLSGTSQTVLLSSTLWNPDFIALAAVSRRQVEFSPTAPTRPTKYNCCPSWLRGHIGRHGWKRPPGLTTGHRFDDSELNRGHWEVRLQARFFRLFITINPSWGSRWQVEGWAVDSVESLAASSVDPPVSFPNTSGESKSIYTFI